MEGSTDIMLKREHHLQCDKCTVDDDGAVLDYCFVCSFTKHLEEQTMELKHLLDNGKIIEIDFGEGDSYLCSNSN